jgi:NADH-quinone oxidoreductase subunit M
MILLWLLIVTVAGAIAAWVLGWWSKAASRWVTLVALFADCVLLLVLWAPQWTAQGLPPGEQWLAEFDWPWIGPLGVRFHLAADGLSLLLLALTVFLGIAAVSASWTEIQARVGAFHLCLLMTLAGIMGVFTALDLFLFYFFWELMLVPMYFLIAIWGHENRVPAAIKFFLFTQGGSLLMFVAILALYFIHGRDTGVYSFDYRQWVQAEPTGAIAWWLMLGFFISFAVKLPVVGLHTWLPDAHTEAPTGGSVLLAGLLLKTGAYGLLRFALPLFPTASNEIAWFAMILGVAGILYGAFLAFAQPDAKRLVAYTSVSHLGFVLLGIYAGTNLALQGAIVILLAHGLSAGGLFIVVGAVQERLHTRQLDELGGLWSSMPRLGGVALLLALASLGLPGLANFVGEFLVLTGTFAVSPTLAAIGAIGFVLSSVYSLWLIYRVFQGPQRQAVKAVDLGAREMVIFSLIIAAILWLGLYPQPVLNTARPPVESLLNSITHVEGEPGSQPQTVSFEAPAADYDRLAKGDP